MRKVCVCVCVCVCLGTKNQYIGENCLKRGGGAWTVLRFNRGLAEKGGGGGVFEGRVDTPIHTRGCGSRKFC